MRGNDGRVAIRTTEGHILNSYVPDHIDWYAYEGYELATTDGVRLGIVESVLVDERTGEHLLSINTNQQTEARLRVPINAVGVISRSRLLLDIMADRIDIFRMGWIDYSDQREAR